MKNLKAYNLKLVCNILPLNVAEHFLKNQFKKDEVCIKIKLAFCIAFSSPFYFTVIFSLLPNSPLLFSLCLLLFSLVSHFAHRLLLSPYTRLPASQFFPSHSPLRPTICSTLPSYKLFTFSPFTPHYPFPFAPLPVFHSMPFAHPHPAVKFIILCISPNQSVYPAWVHSTLFSLVPFSSFLVIQTTPPTLLFSLSSILHSPTPPSQQFSLSHFAAFLALHSAPIPSPPNCLGYPPLLTYPHFQSISPHSTSSPSLFTHPTL